MQTILLIFQFILGACFGSFLCCQARRLHLIEERTEECPSGKQRPKAKPSSSKSQAAQLGKRSVCLSCHTKLAWYDNIPIFSWLVLRGKCRKCGKRIGMAELLSELGVAFAFLALGFTIQISSASILEWIIFITTLIFVLVLAFLAIYDGLYGKLPTVILILSVLLGFVVLVVKEWLYVINFGFSVQEVLIQPLLSVLILGGIYLFLYLLSHGKWVGDGDWILCTGIALALVNPWLAFITLFLANFLACLVSYPIIRKRKNHKIHLGPFLVIAFVIVATFARPLLTLVVF